ncbi:MAG: CRTAC1 family protein [Anaerolineae bacterium]
MFQRQSHLLYDNPTQKNYGIAILDIDQDGHPEAFVTVFGFRNLVLKWDGDKYVDIAPPELADNQRQAIGVAAADFDGDGLEELYVLNTDTFGGPKRFGDRLFDFAGGEWTDLFSLPVSQGIRNMTAGRSVITVDRTGRGRYGFYVANYGGPVRLYELDDDGYVVDVAPDVGVNLVTGGRAAVSLPLISRHMDIFAANELGPNFLFVNNGNGLYEEVAVNYNIGDAGQNGRGIAVLDANGDGQLDLVYGNWEGPHRMFVRQGSSEFRDIAPPEMAAPSRIRSVIAADFDNDGYEEIFFNNIGEPNRLFAWRDERWQQVAIGEAEEALGVGTGAAAADLNGDGRLELLIAHGEQGPQPLSLFAAAENDHHWIRVMPLTEAGAPARGAIVRVTAGGRTQVRAVDAGSGYLCQMEPVAHFGLGPVDAVEAVEVIFPGGETFSLEAPAVRETHTVQA